MSIGEDVSDKGTPAECYVLDRSDMVTLPEYLHTLFSKTLDNLSKLWFNVCITLADTQSVTARLRVCLPTLRGLKV